MTLKLELPSNVSAVNFPVNKNIEKLFFRIMRVELRLG